MKFIYEKQYKIGKINIIYIDWFEVTKYLSFLSGMIASLGIWGLYKFDDGKKLGLIVAITALVLHIIIMYIIKVIREEHKY